ncbi:uncharacterized protein [Clytia hemisphaerica]|uniref:RING-CH-type domain-containing protein n=1 Tax=Clytia hemisphaerica TaxID=252671 RepID=A0A7M5X3R6_9CNID|eukprot:TCONS_00051896-protein
MAETELLLASSSPTSSIQQTEEYVVISSNQNRDKKEENRILVPLSKVPLLNACSLRKDKGTNNIQKSLENFTDSNTNTNNDGSPSTITKSRSRSCGFISDVNFYNEPLEISINNKEGGVVQATTNAQASPLDASNTRIFTANRIMHCDDSSCSGGQGSPLGNAPNIELRNINGQILMMPKRPSLDAGDLEMLIYNSQPSFMFRAETSQSSESVFCRICHCIGEEKLIAPCKCAGSTRYVHASCLVTWFKKSVKHQCELCKSDVKIRKINHRILLWRKPEDRPVPLIWFTVFFIGLFLNIISIYVNASDYCESTACLIFYVVNGFGIVLDAAFLWFWFLKCKHYWKKWCALNQDWFIDDGEVEDDQLHVRYVQGCPA